MFLMFNIVKVTLIKEIEYYILNHAFTLFLIRFYLNVFSQFEKKIDFTL